MDEDGVVLDAAYVDALDEDDKDVEGGRLKVVAELFSDNPSADI